MNYIITKNPAYFEKIGLYHFCELDRLATLPNKVTFDSETTGLFALEEDMFCIQIGTGTDNYIVDLYNDSPEGESCYTFYDVIPYLRGKFMIMQNGLFDIGFMYKYRFTSFEVGDTMLGTRILYNGDFHNRRSDFQAIMQRELGVWYNKTDQKNIHLVKLSQESTIEYSFNDVDRLGEAHNKILEKLSMEGAMDTYRLHCRFIKALAYMEQCGLPLDRDLWLAKMDVDKQNEAKYQKEVEDYIYDHLPKYRDTQIDLFEGFQKNVTLNINSPDQMVPVFNAFEINTKDKDGKDSTDKKILSKSKHEFIKIWFKYQEAHHRVTTFGEKILDKLKPNGRIYTNFNPMVDTSRLASRKGSINFLNFPSDGETRSCFKAKPGNKMIVCDWSGQETVIAADVSGDEAMTKSVVEGADLHSMMARVIFPELADLSDEEIINNHSKKRSKAKAPRFAMQYGGNAYTLHVNENMPLDEAEEIFEKFILLHEGLFNWGDRQLKLALKRGYIKSADGWRLHLPKFDLFKELEEEINAITKEQWTVYRRGKTEFLRERKIREYNENLEEGKEKKKFICADEKAYAFYKKKKKPISMYFSRLSEYKRLALNNPIQTRGAHQMKLALSMIFEWIVENDLMGVVLMCNAVHDETVVECPEDLAEEVKDVVERCMREAGDHYLQTLNIKADANIGESWYEAK